MRKLCRERCVCAPQSRSAEICNGPKASLSTRTLADLLRALAMKFVERRQTRCSQPKATPIGTRNKWRSARRRRLFFPETVKADDFSATVNGLLGLLGLLGLFAFGGRS